MWILTLLAVNIFDPSDVPGKIQLTFPTEQQCESVASTMTYKLKFDGFKVISQCKPL
jgi:hypothetical protein